MARSGGGDKILKTNKINDIYKVNLWVSQKNRHPELVSGSHEASTVLNLVITRALVVSSIRLPPRISPRENAFNKFGITEIGFMFPKLPHL